QHKGKTILYCDFRNQIGAEAITTLDEEAKEIKTWTRKGLILSDFRGAKASPEFMAYAKKIGKEVFAPMTQKVACIGLSGVQSVLLQAYNTFTADKIIPFKTEEEAKDWLIKD
ncbi:MAG TPA: hypothetical protein PLR10_01560, partial [Smithella sp.]|nr:hypothetical protein [Smithella sp.]